MEPPKVSSRVFKAVQTVDVEALSQVPDLELRPVLASLVRMSLIASLDKSSACYEGRTAVLRILSRVELVNNLVALLSIGKIFIFCSVFGYVQPEVSPRNVNKVFLHFPPKCLLSIFYDLSKFCI